MESSNDNEPFTFQSLGLATALMLNRIKNAQTLLELAKINEQKDERRRDKAERADQNKKDSPEHRRAVDQRLRELSAFEHRFMSHKDLKRVR